jgi:hypothetical protein
MSRTSRTFTGNIEDPRPILRPSGLKKRNGRPGLLWKETVEETTIRNIDRRINWRYIESIAHRRSITYYDKHLGVRRMTPEIHPKDDPSFSELAPRWSIRDSKGEWSPFTLKISPSIKLEFEINLALREEGEKKGDAEWRAAERKAAERKAAERKAAERKAAERKTTSGIVACPVCTFHNTRGMNACGMCDSSLLSQYMLEAKLALREAAEKNTVPEGLIACPKCTFHNLYERNYCEKCNSFLV